MRKWLLSTALLSTALLASACGGGYGGGGNAAGPTMSSSPLAVSAFMRAAADSNLARMADLWGTERGPASKTHPEGYEKRLVLLQVYLRGDSTRILSDDPVAGEQNQRRVAMALHRGTCVKQIPVTTIRTRDGAWLVHNIDLNQAGNPARPCEP